MTPKYKKLADELRQNIIDGTLKPGERLPSFDEMRAEYGLGQATWERIYSLLEQDGLVLRQQGRGTFVAERQAVSTRIIGFVNDDSSHVHDFWGQLFGGVQEAALKEGYQILSMRSDSEANWDKVEGVILYAIDSSRPENSVLVSRPRVSLVETRRDMTSVVADDYDGAQLAIKHLLSLGHRRIATLMQSTSLPRLRLAGYRDALMEAGVEPRAEWAWQIAEPVWLWEHLQPEIRSEGYVAFGRQAMENWLRTGWKELGCTAILAQNDHVAVGAIQALAAAGLRVPEDVSVVGFDGLEISKYHSPSLTSVAIPLRQIGATAVRSLLDQIAGRVERSETITLPVTLEIRNSTGVLLAAGETEPVLKAGAVQV